jgi:glycosyltransferase involved in cell wall biosynthesis
VLPFLYKSMPQRILIVTGIFPPELGGPATYAPELAKRLKKDGFVVKMMTYSDSSGEPTDGELGYELIRVRRRGKVMNYFRFFIALLKELKSVDFVYSLDTVTAGLPLALATMIMRRQFILRVGGSYIWEKYLADGKPPMSLAQFYSNGKYREYRLLFTVINFVFRRARFVVFNSREQLDLYDQYYGGINADRSGVIRNPFAGVVLEATRDGSAITNEIVFAGRFIKMKNVESLISAFNRMRTDSAQLVLIGEGPTEVLLRSKVDECGIAGRVNFLPPLSRTDLYKRVLECRALVIPSWTDISPNQLFEALSLGIPVLLTKEHFSGVDTSDVVTIDPSDESSIANALDSLFDREAYDEFSRKMVAKAESRTWDTVYAEHIEMFKKHTK